MTIKKAPAQHDLGWMTIIGFGTIDPLLTPKIRNIALSGCSRSTKEYNVSLLTIISLIVDRQTNPPRYFYLLSFYHYPCITSN